MAKNKTENAPLPPNLEPQPKEQQSILPKIIDEKGYVSETEITGVAASEMYSLLSNPPKNPRKNQLIRAALNRFPHPEQVTQLDLDL